MKKNVLKISIIFCILFGTQSVKAQSVITEFFPVNGSFYFDIKDKRVQKIMSSKGLLDIDWNEDKRILSVSYPLMAKLDIKEVVEGIKKVSGAPLPAQRSEVKTMPVTPF